MDRLKEDVAIAGAAPSQPPRPDSPIPHSLTPLTRVLRASLTNLCDAATAQTTTPDNQCLKDIFSSPCDQPPQPPAQQQQHGHSPATCIDLGTQMPTGSARTTSSPTLSLSDSASTPVDRSDCDTHNADEISPGQSVCSIGSVVCRICHNNENPENLVAPCLCKGSLTYVHIECLERWITTSRSTMCELCQFRYDTQQTLRYTLCQSLRMWYSRSMSRRALQEDCQMFSLLTLVAFGIIGTLLVGIQYYILQEQSWGLARLWTRGWLVFFLLTTLSVYLINVYMILRSQLVPWYRWWQSAREIKLILENRKPLHLHLRRHHATPPSQPAPTTESMTNLLEVRQTSSFPECGETTTVAAEEEPAVAHLQSTSARPTQAVTIPLVGTLDIAIPLDDLVFEL